ncbi:2og-fe oxygenase superfamily [Fusarium sporotrichioides]|uniref:2og-fe oxygenase superfamily n=1 Tax=Fusarium sporotrichioides TaxID=5514 RepID=A0A395SAV2_FUSSP|nr:2og-fe oxygenase superfamily [Fusarium sporotrichioides]
MFVNPGLTIDGGNQIPLPLKEDDAQTIKGVCRQAPFGHGDKTLVDTSIRNTWELDASKFELRNPEWPKFFDKVLQDTAVGLGLNEVIAKSYKLLLYEPGSFFKPHKDSEKERGMVGTLIVCLPSQHEGGDVHLSFGSKVTRFSTAPTSKFDLNSISWFSDVTHEVTKLTSGYRLVLTYKLFIYGDGSVSASTALDKTEHLRSLLHKWKSRPCQPDRIIYPLDHLYTETSLCLENMKGRDRGVAYSLNKTCSESGFYLMLAHATHVRMGEDGYGGYDEGSEEYGNLRYVYTPSGVQVASNLTIDGDEILGYDINKEDPDSEDEGEFTGNENMAPTFRYHKTVVVLVLKDRLRKYLQKNVGRFFDSAQRAQNDRLTEMVIQDLANNRSDAYTRQAAAGFMDNVLHCSTEPQGPIVRLISKWALELDNITMFRTCVRATYAPPGSRGSRPPAANQSPHYVYAKAVSDELISHLKTHCDGQEHTIDWDYWFKDLGQAIDIAAEFDAFCVVFRSSAKHEPLLESFKAWAVPICDKKLMSQTLWTLSDEKYLLLVLEKRNADSEWVLQSFLPTVVPRFHRSLLWTFLRSITAERSGPFKNSIELYRCIIEHGKGQLSLCGDDIMEQESGQTCFHGNNFISKYTADTRHLQADDQDHRTSCKKFIRMMKESYIHGAGQEALELLQQSCQRLIEERQVWSSVSVHHLMSNFLEPLIIALETINVPPVPAVHQFFEVTLRDVVHQPIMSRPVQLEGWAHEKAFCTALPNCSPCQAMNAFLENSQRQIWHFPAAKYIRQHVECQLTDPIYSLQTIKDRTPHTLVVTKLGTHYDKSLRIWQQKAQQIAHSIRGLRRDYTKSLLGEEKYNALIIIGQPSQENPGTTSQANGDCAHPNAKRRRIWECM